MYARRLRRGFGAGNRLIRNNEQSRSQDYGVRFGRNQLRSREFTSSAIRYGGISRFCGLRFGGLMGRDCYCALSELRFTKDAIFSNRIGSDGGIGIRDYSSEGDGRNASEGKQAPSGKIGEGREESSSGMESWGEKESFFAKNSNEHRLLNERDQKEWLRKEKASRESKKKEIFLSRKQRCKKEFEKGLHKWEKISISLDNFPYPIRKETKDALVECASAHLKHQKFCGNYGSRLKSSNERILLESPPGMELYRERVVKALARDLQTSLLIVDSSFLASHDAESEADAESEDAQECVSDSEMEDESDANEEDWDSSSDAKSDGSDDENHTGVQASVEAIQKLIPNAADEFVKKEGAEAGDSSSSTKSEAEPSQQPERPLRKGDRVKYVAGRATESPVNTRISLGKVASSYGTIDVHTFITSRQLSNGERGEVFEVNGDQAAVIMDNDNSLNNEVNDVNSNKDYSESTLCFVNVKELQHDEDAQAEDWYIALNALFELLPVVQPVIIYFPDSEQWLARVVPKSSRRSFLAKAEDILSKLSGPLVVICGRNKFEPGQKEKNKPRMVFPQLRIDRLPLSLKHLAEGLKGSKKSKPADVDRIFSNVISLQPPKDDELLRKFYKQIEEDKKIISSRSNIRRIHDVLEENDLLCSEVEDVNAEKVVLTKQKAEKVVGWARNHYLSGCSLPSVKDEKLLIPYQSLDVAISRLKEQESVLKKPSHSLKNLAADQFESSYLSAVVAADEIGVRFDDIGALEDVKQTLNELVTLPMRRPELFLHGNLLRPVKGVLLFGPPGTGKTMLAKALATEAGANFLSITGSSVTSKWFGEAEKLAKALFSFASKITPVIIFIDEVDGLLGARGGSFEHEATRRMRNEFMAAWDGLRSRESQRIMVLGATNRPFDLDDAVIRRLPRRIYVDLPDAINRAKILKILLAGENLDVNFKYEDLAHATEGYSGSDLKNLCISAAYRPVQELLEEEKKVGQSKKAPVLRSLNLEDFVQAKSKVSVSVAYDASSMNELRKWNEQYGEGGSRSKKPFGFGVA